MTLSQQHRTVIYEQIVPLFGEETAEAAVAQYPTTDGDEVVAKQCLRAEMAEFRTDMFSLGIRLLLAIIPSIIAGLGVAAANT